MTTPIITLIPLPEGSVLHQFGVDYKGRFYHHESPAVLRTVEWYRDEQQTRCAQEVYIRQAGWADFDKDDLHGDVMLITLPDGVILGSNGERFDDQGAQNIQDVLLDAYEARKANPRRDMWTGPGELPDDIRGTSVAQATRPLC